MNEEDLEFSRAAVALLRGVVERRADEALYQTICAQEQALKEYFHRLGLLLTVDAADEYAYLRQDEASGVPRLMARTQLSYPLSLLLLLLRKRLGEYDALEGDSRLILSSAQMAEMLAPFFPQVTDRVRFLARVRQQAERAASLGFLHRLAGEDAYEVLPLLRSFVTGAWLEEFSERLAVPRLRRRAARDRGGAVRGGGSVARAVRGGAGRDSAAAHVGRREAGGNGAAACAGAYAGGNDAAAHDGREDAAAGAESRGERGG